MISLDMHAVFNGLIEDLGFQKSRVYLLRRHSREGMPFLTKTLPTLSKHILACIEKRTWTPFQFEGVPSFKVKGSQRFTAFLADELEDIFGLSKDPERATFALWRIRQLCEYCYKLALPFTDAQLVEAEAKFVACEKELRSFEYDWGFVEKVRQLAEQYFVKTKSLTLSDCISAGRDGPGTFAGMTYDSLQMAKDTLHCTFPKQSAFASGLFRFRKSSIINGLRNRLHPVDTELASDVLFVPKDSRGPRTIVREPYHNLKVQMGFHDVVKASLERDTFGRIQFTSQEIFRDLARRSSTTKEFATLDLKEASDRVSVRVFRTVFRNFPAFSAAERHFRTKYASLPSGGRLELSKLAGMGSGFTFPCMSAIIYCAILAGLPKPWRRAASREIYVYGDDVIVPSRHYRSAVSSLEKVGLMVNISKSFVNSNFRESCGGDFYFGQNVAPVRLKLNFLSSLRPLGANIVASSSERENVLLKIERHARELVSAGLVGTSKCFYTILERYLGPLPFVSGASPIMGRYSCLQTHLSAYELSEYGLYPEVSVFVPTPKEETTMPPGYDRSFRAHLLSLSDEVIRPEKPSKLFYDSKRYALRLTKKLVSAFSLHM